jgi:hypothetical protein
MTKGANMDVTEAEVEAGAAAIRWLADEAIDPIEVARDVLTAAAQVRRAPQQDVVEAYQGALAKDLSRPRATEPDQGPSVLGIERGEE